jgi:hypothetical protein
MMTMMTMMKEEEENKKREGRGRERGRIKGGRERSVQEDD